MRPLLTRVALCAATAGALALSATGTALADDPPIGPSPSPSPTVITYAPGSVVTVVGRLSTLSRAIMQLDVSGMDQSSAQAAFDGQFQLLQTRTIPLSAHRTNATGVGFYVHLADFEPGGAQATPQLGEPHTDGRANAPTFTVNIGLTKYKAFAQKAAKAVALKAINARAQLDAKKGVIFLAGRPAAALDTVRLPREVLDAFARGYNRLRVIQTAAQYSGTQNQNIILIHTAANTLDYFIKGKKVKHLVVATGQAGYPTPHGLFHVIRKDPAPSWYNPHDDWSKDLPDVIGPGPNNPLGTRALQLDAPGILIHGIPLEENATLGQNASHGCIRVKRENIEALYPTVPVGTLVVIVT
ncbi:MAG TPA: L,D-transpeptidase [Mycobacteriales bacterium]|nr:L,D-transpeptidase [Mycobacteriales bacterium]